MNKKVIAVTGSSGFIGSHLISGLQSAGYNLLEIDIENGFDILDWKKLNKIGKFDIMIHLAAKSFVPDSFKNPKRFFEFNYLSTLNALEISKNHNAKFIYFSSYLYGNPKYLPIDENHPFSPHNPYAQSKLICEKLCEGYYRDFNVPITIFRPFNIYGSGQSGNFVIPSIIDQLNNGMLTLKDPRPKRDYVHVKDIVQAVLLAIEYDNCNMEIFNLGYGKSHSVEDVALIIHRLLKSKYSIRYMNKIRQNEVLDSVADIKKAKDILGWNPKYTIEEGIMDCLKES